MIEQLSDCPAVELVILVVQMSPIYHALANCTIGQLSL